MNDSATHRGPLCADLPLTADLQLAGAGRFGSLQVSAAAGVNVEGAIGVNLATQHLPMLHAEATGLATFGPLSNVPAAREKNTRTEC